MQLVGRISNFLTQIKQKKKAKTSGQLLSEEILQTIHKKFNFERTTPVQASTIPQMLHNRDVVVEASTGSGKTLAYLVPIFEVLIRKRRNTQKSTKRNMNKNNDKNNGENEKEKEEEEGLKKNHVYAMIITPTRELARQVYGVAKVFSDFINNNCKKEGMDMRDEIHTKLLVGGDLDVLRRIKERKQKNKRNKKQQQIEKKEKEREKKKRKRRSRVSRRWTS